jgi:hypothetical protein
VLRAPSCTHASSFSIRKSGSSERPGRRDYPRNGSTSTLLLGMAQSGVRFRSAKPDIWLTISGWIWLAYAAAVLALLTAAAA